MSLGYPAVKYIDNNFLTDLEFSPEFVGEDFHCSNNNLTDLKNSPKIIEYDFYCESNQIKTLEGFNSNFKGYFYCKENPISIFDLHGSQSDVVLDFAIINPIRKGKVVKYLLDLFKFAALNKFVFIKTESIHSALLFSINPMPPILHAIL